MVSAFLGASISLTGTYQPFITASGIFATVGAGLIYSLDGNSSSAKYLGYQAILGVGMGLGIQVPMIAMQALSDPADMGPNTAIILCKSPTADRVYVTEKANRVALNQSSNSSEVRCSSRLQKTFSPTAFSYLSLRKPPASPLPQY